MIGRIGEKINSR